jgi:hypothetical protein
MSQTWNPPFWDVWAGKFSHKGSEYILHLIPCHAALSFAIEKYNKCSHKFTALHTAHTYFGGSDGYTIICTILFSIAHHIVLMVDFQKYLKIAKLSQVYIVKLLLPTTIPQKGIKTVAKSRWLV